MIKKWLIGLLLLVSVPVAFAQDDIHTLIQDDVERSYYLHLPPDYEDSDSLPLVVALHPAASSGKAMAALTGLDAAADAHGFIAVYPNTQGYAWNDGRNNDYSLVSEADDVAFITALIDDLSENYPIGPVYLMGFGGGGLMAFRLACESPERFAGVAVVGTLMWEEHRQNCPRDLSSPVNLLVIHGTDDWFYQQDTYTFTSPFAPDDKGVVILGVEDTLKFWAERNGCTDTPDDFRYTACQEGTRVTYYPVQGGGQNWPRAGDYDLNQFGIDATEISLNFFEGEANWAPEQPEFTDLARSYILYVPNSYTPDTPMPLVMVLHGRPDTGLGAATITDMNLVAEKEGFIVVYPNGIDRQWNYVQGVPFFDQAEQDDFSFIRSLIADLSKDLAIDQSRLYVTGFSNGGFMVNRLACEMPDQFAAFASVGGSMFTGFEEICPSSTGVNMLIMHGTLDVSIPWNGLPENYNGQTIYSAMPVNDVVSFWGVRNECAKSPEIEVVPESGNSPGTHVEIVRLPCAKELTVYVIFGGGHNWPGVPGRISERIAGAVNMDIHGSEVIWEFFSRHTREVED